MVRWASHNTGACSWRWMQENEASLTEGERQVIEFNKRFNVVAGYTISFPEVSTRSRGAIGLTARARVCRSATSRSGGPNTGNSSIC
jgi:hypothetical protein